MELKPISDFFVKDENPIIETDEVNGYDESHYYLPSGIMLVKKDDSLVLIGDDIKGQRTKGCNCCSSEWFEDIEDYKGYYDYRELLGLIPKPEVDPFEDFKG